MFICCICVIVIDLCVGIVVADARFAMGRILAWARTGRSRVRRVLMGFIKWRNVRRQWMS